MVREMKLTELLQSGIRQKLDSTESSSGLLLLADKLKDLKEQFESLKGALQRKTYEPELQWVFMERKQKYIEQKTKEIETREAILEEERRYDDDRRKEIEEKHQLAEKYSELVREKEIMLDVKLEKVREKAERLDETESLLDRKKKSANKRERKLYLKQKSIQVSEKELTKRLVQFELKEKWFVAKMNEFKSEERQLEGIVDTGHPLQPVPITFIVEEMIDVDFTCDGMVAGFDVEGRLSVQILEKKDAYIQIQVESGGNPGISFTTHPQINEELFASDNIIGLSDSNESFPICRSEDGVDILRWSVAMDSEDAPALPLKIVCWPTVCADKTCVRVEYDASSVFELQNVVITVPIPNVQEVPSVKQIDGEWRYDFRKSILEWSVGLIDNSNRSGSMEFVVPPVKYASVFVPISARFSSPSTCIGLKVVNVLPMKPVPPPKYTQKILLQTRTYDFC